MYIADSSALVECRTVPGYPQDGAGSAAWPTLPIPQFPSQVGLTVARREVFISVGGPCPIAKQDGGADNSPLDDTLTARP